MAEVNITTVNDLIEGKSPSIGSFFIAIFRKNNFFKIFLKFLKPFETIRALLYIKQKGNGGISYE